MTNEVNQLWDNESAAQFAATLAVIDDQKAMQTFLRDVMTEKEITEMSARLEAASMLKEGKTYAEIIEKTKLSSRTVARISDWLQNGMGGYKAALDIVSVHHDHTPPARAA